MLDLEPATSRMAEVLRRIRDDQLALPTPCAGRTLGDLVDHVDGLAFAFTAAAKEGGVDQGPSADGSRLGEGWRERIAERLDGLAGAWRNPAAWQGMTRVGGMELPGQVAGLVALTEVIIHGWDIARASGQPFDCDPQLLEACHGHVAAVAAAGPTEGLFGPPVVVPPDASLLDRVIGLSGRDPAWHTG